MLEPVDTKWRCATPVGMRYGLLFLQVLEDASVVQMQLALISLHASVLFVRIAEG